MLSLLFWLLLLAVVAALLVLVIPALRQALITRWVFLWFSKIMPPMSATEREAIAAGDTWQEANLFQGNPQWDKFLANPKPSLSAAENDFLNNQVETLCNMLNDWEITHEKLDLTKEVWDYLKENGFLGLHVPTEYGGLGFSALASSTIVQKISTKSTSAAVAVMVPNSLGPAELILHYGTNEQKQKYLPALAKGIEFPCFALTSPEAGSDAGAIIDNGVIMRGNFGGKKDILGIKLNWNKRYITLAPAATLLGLAVKLYDPEHLLGDKVELGITVILMPVNTPGVETGKRHYPLNQAFLNGPTRGVDVFVPLDFVIGGAERVGRGWQMLVECLAAGRAISLPALGTATGKHCFRVTGAYAKLRQQFNLSIGKFEGVAAALARIGGYTYLLESTRLLTLGAIDQKIQPAVISAICKYHMTEMGRVVINDAMDIHGGRGIMLGPRNYLARIYEAMPVSITVEGANILTRCLMIFGQGAIRCHPYVRQEMDAVANPDKQQGLLAFDRALSGHVVYTTRNFIKLMFHSLSNLMLCSTPKLNSKNQQWSKYYKAISFFSLALACTSDVAMLVLGGDLKRKENLSARLGDVLSYLYMASAVLKYHQDHDYAQEDQIYVTWSLDYCLYQIQHAFEYFLVNFPNRIIAVTLQSIIFFWWRKYRLPSDSVGLQISQNMMQDTSLRDRLTAYCANDKDSREASGRVEQAWRKMLQVEPLLAKLDHAVKEGKIVKGLQLKEKVALGVQLNLITAIEAQQITEFDAMRLDALQVDEFTNAQLTGKK